MRRKLIALTLASFFALSTGTAFADRSFGPGNGGGSGNEKCHPPGQTTGTPGCK